MWSKEQKYRHGLTHNPKFQLCRVFSRNDLVEKKFWNRRKKFLEFKEKLGLDPNKYNFDEQDIISALQLAFEGEIMNTQNCIQNKRPDLFFLEHKLATWNWWILPCRHRFWIRKRKINDDRRKTWLHIYQN